MKHQKGGHRNFDNSSSINRGNLSIDNRDAFHGLHSEQGNKQVPCFYGNQQYFYGNLFTAPPPNWQGASNGNISALCFDGNQPRLYHLAPAVLRYRNVNQTNNLPWVPHLAPTRGAFGSTPSNFGTTVKENERERGQRSNSGSVPKTAPTTPPSLLTLSLPEQIGHFANVTSTEDGAGNPPNSRTSNNKNEPKSGQINAQNAQKFLTPSVLQELIANAMASAAVKGAMGEPGAKPSPIDLARVQERLRELVIAQCGAASAQEVIQSLVDLMKKNNEIAEDLEGRNNHEELLRSPRRNKKSKKKQSKAKRSTSEAGSPLTIQDSITASLETESHLDDVNMGPQMVAPVPMVPSAPPSFQPPPLLSIQPAPRPISLVPSGLSRPKTYGDAASRPPPPKREPKVVPPPPSRALKVQKKNTKEGGLAVVYDVDFPPLPTDPEVPTGAPLVPKPGVGGPPRAPTPPPVQAKEEEQEITGLLGDILEQVVVAVESCEAERSEVTIGQRSDATVEMPLSSNDEQDPEISGSETGDATPKASEQKDFLGPPPPQTEKPMIENYWLKRAEAKRGRSKSVEAHGSKVEQSKLVVTSSELVQTGCKTSSKLDEELSSDESTTSGAAVERRPPQGAVKKRSPKKRSPERAWPRDVTGSRRDGTGPRRDGEFGKSHQVTIFKKPVVSSRNPWNRENSVESGGSKGQWESDFDEELQDIISSDNETILEFPSLPPIEMPQQKVGDADRRPPRPAGGSLGKAARSNVADGVASGSVDSGCDEMSSPEPVSTPDDLRVDSGYTSESSSVATTPLGRPHASLFPPTPRQGQLWTGAFPPSVQYPPMMPCYLPYPLMYTYPFHHPLVGGSAARDLQLLTMQIRRHYTDTVQTPAVLERKYQLRDYLADVVQEALHSECELHIVGSSLNGFGSKDSDLDICLMFPAKDEESVDPVEVLTEIYKSLTKKNERTVRRQQLIHARVPILRIQFGRAHGDVQVDLNCNNPVGIRNTALLKAYSDWDERVAPLIMVVKEWAARQNINDAACSTLSSYSLELMVLNFLQCGVNPPILPSLQTLYPHQFDCPTEAGVSVSSLRSRSASPDLEGGGASRSSRAAEPTNRMNLGELLIRFLEHYVFAFSYEQEAVSVRCGTKIPKYSVQSVSQIPNDQPPQWRLLCIEEPFTQSNTARSVYDELRFRHVLETFHRSWQVLVMTRNLNAIMQPLY